MITVREVLEGKVRVVWTVAPSAPVFEAMKLMADRGVGALIVKDGADLAGIMSERDCARKVLLRGRSPHQTSCREIMTSKVFVVFPERTVDECMALMTEKRIRHLPVIDEDELVGIVSIGDCIKAAVSNQQFIIERLESCIRGG